MPLTNYDFPDYELLQTIEREKRGNTADLANTLNREVSSTASRLAWMKRMGLAERTIASNWVLTPKGREMLNGRSDDIMDVRSISSRAKRSPAAAWVIRREFQRDLR
jgi:DNA-binding IclR family transcriptional regulator